MKIYLTIKADTNDADYVEKTTAITQEQLNLLLPVFAAINAFKPYRGTSADGGYTSTQYHNWPHGCGEFIPRYDLGEKPPAEIYPQLTEEQVNLFNDFCPYGEYGTHTIANIRVMHVESEEVYYTHKHYR